MHALIYSKDNCPFCVKAKYIFESQNIPYKEINIGRDITREEFLELFPDQKTVPLIFIDTQKIGGYSELVKHIEKNDGKL